MTKAELRKTYLAKRLALSESDYKKLNQKLCENFFTSINLSEIKVIHTFLPIEKTKEPDTWLIIQKIAKEFPGISISIPKINNQTSNLDNFYYEGAKQLELNTWGIPEPKEGIPTPIDKIDAVLVPLLAFDMQGHRVGYGRGFYDKFLDQCPATLKKIGLSFFEPVQNIGDINKHDHGLTHAVTPAKVFQFN
jgi:5-formyltetrahydrofolate cyclo-ligase